MASTDSVSPTIKASSAVPLDTIPISPEKDNSDPKMSSVEANDGSKTTDEPVTVFHDPENFNVKHPLIHEWTLWFTKPPSGKVRILRIVGRDGLQANTLPG